jgi:hypothetical protein
MLQLYRADSLKITESEWAKCNLDLVAVQDVRWAKGSSQKATIIHFSMEIGMLIIT